MADVGTMTGATVLSAFPATLPEFYTDASTFDISAYTFSIRLGVGTEQQVRPVALVRMSHAHAKVLTIMLKKALKEAEEQLGPISIHQQLLEERGIDLERDW